MAQFDSGLGWQQDHAALSSPCLRTSTQESFRPAPSAYNQHLLLGADTDAVTLHLTIAHPHKRDVASMLRPQVAARIEGTSICTCKRPNPCGMGFDKACQQAR
eukprot:1411110-Amphidinium_carterae.2